MNGNIHLSSLLNRFPEIESLIAAYDVDLEEDKITNMSIEHFCDSFNVDLEDLLMDIEEVINDSKSTQWLGTEDDNWTEGFTDELENDGNSVELERFDEEDSDDGADDFN
jgi:hypothetical protein